MHILKEKNCYFLFQWKIVSDATVGFLVVVGAKLKKKELWVKKSVKCKLNYMIPNSLWKLNGSVAFH